MRQKVVKLLQQVYFVDMLAGKLFKMRQQCFRMFSHTRITFSKRPKWQYISSKNNGSRNREIAAGKVICR